ncbi:MAG: HAD family phosphatase [Chlorobi bacterium]|nr:HAD family phosphatase [Chlorobiota bacterium]
MITTLCFDLGNVLLFFDHVLIARRLGEAFAVDPERLCRDPRFVSLMVRNESGELDGRRLYREIMNAYGKGAQLSFDAFKEAWSDIFTPNTELIEILPLLAKRYQLRMLSNTNDLHIDWCMKNYPEVFRHFERLVFSYEIGSRKPAPEAFRALCLGVKPEHCLYVDDILSYVEAAREWGMHAVQYRGMDDLRSAFSSFDIDLE